MTPNTRTLKGQSYCSQRWANPVWPKGSKSRGFSICPCFCCYAVRCLAEHACMPQRTACTGFGQGMAQRYRFFRKYRRFVRILSRAGRPFTACPCGLRARHVRSADATRCGHGRNASRPNAPCNVPQSGGGTPLRLARKKGNPPASRDRMREGWK